ncbi:MAG TPA: pilus assembly protein TadG-related protein, partial [Candidatus Angelobacter sp.]|nr:pilus assembly protein TadG-related protein [Candidatus Angelobacter sp.]
MRIYGYRRSRKQEKGQTLIPIMIMVGLFLLAMLGVAMDYSQVWAHRQMAQAAADAACQAGAADLYLFATDPSISGTGGLTDFSFIGTNFDCSTKPGTPPCQYAAFNGYSGASVNVSFPSSLPGVPALPPSLATTFPYIKVTVSDAVPMSFTRIVSSNPTVTIKATAGCGVNPVSMPTPLVILHQSANAALSVIGSGKIIVFGGPQRSIQVDSKSSTAVSVGTVDLSRGGPNNTGSDLAVFGGPNSQPGGVSLGSTGHYLAHTIPLGDPFVTYSSPATPSTPGSAKAVPFAMNGCPDINGCVEFSPGNYTGCFASGNINPGDKGCLLLPYTGSNPKFSKAADNWLSGHAYTKGALITPTSNNSNFMFVVLNAGTSGAAQPNWNSFPICTRQPNGTCSGGTINDGSVLWQKIGTVTLNKLSTGIFDPGLYYLSGTSGLSFGDGSTARVSTATGAGSNGVMFYFASSATVSVTSNAGKSSACTSVNFSSGTSSPNGCVVSFKIDGTVSTAATGYVPSRALQCPSGSANPPQVPNLLDGNVLLGPCSGTYASPDGNRGFLFF